jgi:hypothetical protein
VHLKTLVIEQVHQQREMRVWRKHHRHYYEYNSHDAAADDAHAKYTRAVDAFTDFAWTKGGQLDVRTTSYKFVQYLIEYSKMK